MNPILEQLNQIGLGIDESFYNLSPEERIDYMQGLTKEELSDIARTENHLQSLVANIRIKFEESLGDLEISELIEGYYSAGKILRNEIGAYIAWNFQPVFIPVMLYAIFEDHDLAYRFLATLYDNADKHVVLIAVGLGLQCDNNRTLKAAIDVVGLEKYRDLLDVIQSFVSHPSPDVANAASWTVNDLRL